MYDTSAPLVVVQASRVYGLNIPNMEAAILTRKVIKVSVLLLALQAAYCIYSTVALSQGVYVYGSVFSVLVPMCGYFGARYRNRGLVIVFSLCNCLTAVTLPLSLGFFGIVMHYMKDHIDDWCPDGPTGYPNIPSSGSGSGSKTAWEQVSCQDIYNIVDNSNSLYLFLIPVGVIATLLACVSCTWGFRLANTRYFTVPITQFQTGAVATVAAPAATVAAPAATVVNYMPPQQGVAVGAPAVVVQEQNMYAKATPAVVTVA